MAKLLYKDLRLSNLALVALMMSLCLLMLIPAYLLYMGLIYICLAVFFTQQRFREDNDIYFSMLLPIRKRDIVRGHVLTYSVFELAQLVVADPWPSCATCSSLPTTPWASMPTRRCSGPR